MSELSKFKGVEFSLPIEQAIQRIQEIKFLESMLESHSVLVEGYTKDLENSKLSADERKLTEENLNQALQNIKDIHNNIQDHKMAIVQLQNGDEAMKKLLEEDGRTHEV